MHTRLFLRIAVVLIALLTVSAPAAAEVPQQINYQGYLTDDLGNPQNGNYVMAFAI